MTTSPETRNEVNAEISGVMAEPCEIGRNIEHDWRGSNATRASITDPHARLYRKAKGRPAQLCYMGHAMTENRHGFVVDDELTHADGTAERRAAITMIDRAYPGSTRRIMFGADKGLRRRQARRRVAPHVRLAAHRCESEGLGHRRPDDAARRLQSEPAEAQARRRTLWLG
jgi:hypothetical protein